jgi:hypothetical protein
VARQFGWLSSVQVSLSRIRTAAAGRAPPRLLHSKSTAGRTSAAAETSSDATPTQPWHFNAALPGARMALVGKTGLILHRQNNPLARLPAHPGQARRSMSTASANSPKQPQLPVPASGISVLAREPLFPVCLPDGLQQPARTFTVSSQAASAAQDLCWACVSFAARYILSHSPRRAFSSWLTRS